MSKIYINPEAFKEEMEAKKLSFEQICKTLDYDEKKANSVFNGYVKIHEYRLLLLIEVLGFNYHKITQKERTCKPIKVKSVKPSRGYKNHKELPSLRPRIRQEFRLKHPLRHYPTPHKCSNCKFTVSEVLNYCPNCGSQLSEQIRFCEKDQVYDLFTDHNRLVYTSIFKRRLTNLNLSTKEVAPMLSISRNEFNAILKGEKIVSSSLQKHISQILEAPVHYWSGEAILVDID